RSDMQFDELVLESFLNQLQPLLKVAPLLLRLLRFAYRSCRLKVLDYSRLFPSSLNFNRLILYQIFNFFWSFSNICCKNKTELKTFGEQSQLSSYLFFLLFIICLSIWHFF